MRSLSADRRQRLRLQAGGCCVNTVKLASLTRCSSRSHQPPVLSLPPKCRFNVAVIRSGERGAAGRLVLQFTVLYRFYLFYVSLLCFYLFSSVDVFFCLEFCRI